MKWSTFYFLNCNKIVQFKKISIFYILYIKKWYNFILFVIHTSTIQIKKSTKIESYFSMAALCDIFAISIPQHWYESMHKITIILTLLRAKRNAKNLIVASCSRYYFFAYFISWLNVISWWHKNYSLIQRTAWI